MRDKILIEGINLFKDSVIYVQRESYGRFYLFRLIGGINISYKIKTDNEKEEILSLLNSIGDFISFKDKNNRPIYIFTKHIIFYYADKKTLSIALCSGRVFNINSKSNDINIILNHLEAI